MAFDWSDVQGLIIRGNNFPRSWHIFFSFPSKAAGRSFLTWIRPRLSTATAMGSQPEPLIYLGLTYGGLRTIGAESLLQRFNPALTMSEDPLANPFPSEFIHGPERGPELAALGDFAAEDAPSTWWNQRFRSDDVHASLHIYARTDEVFDQVLRDVRSKAEQFGVIERNANGAEAPPLQGRALADFRQVHFGYQDGIAQPDVDWEQETAVPPRVDRRHFLLGYSGPIPSAPRFSRTGDLFRNSCYLAFRWMSQDVPAFEGFLTQSVPKVAAALPAAPDPRELLAAKLMGRWRSGAPLVLAPLRDDPSLGKRDDFGFRTGDAGGTACPFSSHIRASNPRDQPLAEIVNPEVPRLIRRGMTYGAPWRPGENDGEDRGLFGMFLCASLERQFQQIMRWMNRHDFSDVFAGHSPIRQDPLFGARGTSPARPPFRIAISSDQFLDLPLPDKAFIRSRGTVYLLLPGLATLDRLLAN